MDEANIAQEPANKAESIIEEESMLSITQDATPDSSFAFGYRSPSCSNLHSGSNGGGLSPSHGLSLREFDEKMRALQKENFNLKFRVYFLEQSNAKPNDDESLLKQTIDLKVENEELRKELQEKQELLCQAAKAMELLEQHKQQDSNTDQIENELKSRIVSMEETIKASEIQLKKLTDELRNSQDIIDENDNLIKNREQRIDELESRLVEIQNNISDDQDNFPADSDNVVELKKQILSQKQKLADKLCTIQDLEEKLAIKIKSHEKGCKTIQLLLIKTKELDAEVEELKSKNNGTSTDSKDNHTIATLKTELELAKKDTEQANRWREECVEVCSILTSRLRELAGFLDSLLKREDVLSVLAQDRRKAMRTAVDNSLDLSRSLSISTQGRPSMMDQSLLQMSCISDVLKDSYFAGRRSYDETDARDSSLIDNLRSQIKELQSELDRVHSESVINGGGLNDLRRDKNAVRNLPQVNELNSDSEEWSEPDRQVSHERIGLDESIKMNTHMLSPANGKYKPSISSSASDENNDSRLTRKNSVLRFQEKIIDLESQLRAKYNELSDVQNLVVSNEHDISGLKEEIEDLSNELEKFKEINEKLEMTINEMKEYEREYKNRIQNNDQVIEGQRMLNIELKQEINKLTDEIGAMEKMHQKRLDELIARETEKAEELQKQLTKKYEKDLEQKIAAHKESISRDFVPRTDYDEIIHQNTDFEKRLADAETLLQLMRDNENEVKHEIIEKEQIIRELKRSTDEATLTVSKIVLERTKFMNERDHYEKLSRELKEKIDSLAIESSELHSKLAKLSHDNAQLHNKLVFNETNFQLTRSASQGNARYTMSPPKLILGSSSGDQSGYTSDEARQRLENSSPDLGIDSDGTGRSSGAEVNVSHSIKVPHKTDLNDSFTNILMEDDEENALVPSKLTSPNEKHDCEKIYKENVELRRKLERTRRAFEKTWNQLRISNQRKEQIEKDIRQEIYKTHSVLKNVRSNIENVNSRSIAANPLSKSATTSMINDE